MKERLVRGDLLVPIVRMLKVHRRAHPMELGEWENDLLKRRLSHTTWYALKVFDSLLQTVHRFVLDGSEAAAARLGRSFACVDLEQQSALVVPGDTLATLRAFAPRWRQLFNFGAPELTELPDEAGRHTLRVRVTGFPDMAACIGHAVLGYAMQVGEGTGATEVEARIEERPWMHNSVLTFTLRYA